MITVDLDEPTRLEIVRTWHYVERHGGGDVQGRLSSSREGVHIRSHEVLPAEVPVNEHHRRMAGDDPTRIQGDLDNTMSNNQVLWDVKYGTEPGRWVDSLDALIAAYERQFDALRGNV